MIKRVHFGVLRHWHQLSTFLLLLIMSPSFRGLLPLDPDTFNCPVATGEHGGQAGMKYLRHVIYCVSRWHLLMEFCLRKLRPRIHDSQKWTQNKSKWPHSERFRTRLYTDIRHMSYLSSVLEFGGKWSKLQNFLSVLWPRAQTHTHRNIIKTNSTSHKWRVHWTVLAQADWVSGRRLKGPRMESSCALRGGKAARMQAGRAWRLT